MIGVKKIMTVNLTCDHRLVYGAQASEFLQVCLTPYPAPASLQWIQRMFWGFTSRWGLFGLPIRGPAVARHNGRGVLDAIPCPCLIAVDSANVLGVGIAVGLVWIPCLIVVDSANVLGAGIAVGLVWIANSGTCCGQAQWQGCGVVLQRLSAQGSRHSRRCAGNSRRGHCAASLKKALKAAEHHSSEFMRGHWAPPPRCLNALLMGLTLWVTRCQCCYPQGASLSPLTMLPHRMAFARAVQTLKQVVENPEQLVM